MKLTFTHGFVHISEATFTTCGNSNKVVSRYNSPQFISVLLDQHDFCNFSQQILKKDSFTAVLVNQKKKVIFPLKTALLGESQRLVRWLSNQISSFRLVCLLKFF